MKSGVARRPIVDIAAYKAQLSARRDPIAGAMQRILDRVRRTPRRVVFAEGEEEQVIRAAYSFVNQGLGAAILVGREDRVQAVADASGLDLADKGIEVHNARLSHRNAVYAQFLYEKLQRKGYLLRDCQRLINQDRNYFAAAMVAQGDADAMVTGVTRNFSIALEEIRRVIDDKPGHRVVGVSIIISHGRPVLVADTSITEMPGAEDLAEIAIEAAGVARRLGYEPRVAMLAFSNFGHPVGERTLKVQEAVRILDSRRVDFEYDGEMGADVALNKELMAAYPFCRLTDTANVLVMPAFHSAAISTRMLQELGGAMVLGPLIVGLEKPVQIVSLPPRIRTSSIWRRWRASTSAGEGGARTCQSARRCCDHPLPPCGGGLGWGVAPPSDRCVEVSGPLFAGSGDPPSLPSPRGEECASNSIDATARGFAHPTGTVVVSGLTKVLR